MIAITNNLIIFFSFTLMLFKTITIAAILHTILINFMNLPHTSLIKKLFFIIILSDNFIFVDIIIIVIYALINHIIMNMCSNIVMNSSIHANCINTIIVL